MINVQEKEKSSKMYCMNTNNCNVVKEKNYFVNDYMHIINNLSDHEMNINMMKSPGYNNLFKDVEHFIFI